MKHETLFVFDIETIPDLVSAYNLVGDEDNTARGSLPSLLKEKLVEYHLKITGGKNAFIRQPFHQIVAISFLEAKIHYENGLEYYTFKTVRSGGAINSSEKEIVTGFFKYLSQLKPRLVSFNGKTFDMPVLKYRAMLYNIAAPWLYLSGDKWNNYNSKYSLDWHCDLLEAFSDFSSSARVRMQEVCALLGLPGKMEIKGSMVSDLHDKGDIKSIRDYCELDVLNTYLLYLRHAVHTGRMSKQGYELSVQDLVKFLHASPIQHHQQFLEKWVESAREDDITRFLE